MTSSAKIVALVLFGCTFAVGSFVGGQNHHHRHCEELYSITHRQRDVIEKQESSLTNAEATIKKLGTVFETLRVVNLEDGGMKVELKANASR